MRAAEERLDNLIESKYGHNIVKPAYSYWAVAYALSLKGAKKLIDSEPLKKILPVDEYLPIMFDKHPKYASLN